MKAARSSLDVSGHLEGRELKGGADFCRGQSVFHLPHCPHFRHGSVGGLGLGQAFAQWPGWSQRKQLLGRCVVYTFAGLSVGGQTWGGVQNLNAQHVLALVDRGAECSDLWQPRAFSWDPGCDRWLWGLGNQREESPNCFGDRVFTPK